MDQNRINTITTKLNSILGTPGTPEHVENLAAMQWVVGNYVGVMGIDDANGTASWANERTFAAREFLITQPAAVGLATKLICRALGNTWARNHKHPGLAAYTSALAEWALKPDSDLQEGLRLALSHNDIPAKLRWAAFYGMGAQGFYRLQYLMASMMQSKEFAEYRDDIFEILYSCLSNFKETFPRLHDLATPIGKMPAGVRSEKRTTVRAAAWSHKVGNFLSSATTVHPWLMNLAEPGLEIFILSERRTNDPIQQKYREIYGDKFIDCDGLTDQQFVEKARSLDLDVLIMIHPTRTAWVHEQRVAKCHLDYHGMHRPFAVPDQSLINVGALDMAFAASTGRNMIAIPDPPFVHTPRPPVELKDPGAREFCFGAFNRALKFNSRLLDVWARILTECPKSTLMIAFLQVDFFTEFLMKSEMAKRGVDPQRIKIAPPVGHDQHLERHNAIDIMLDVFPVGAGMTAVDTFYMGVPLLTLGIDYRPCALQTKSVLALVGPDAGAYVATEDEYVAFAKAQYAKGPLKKQRRQVLRDKVNASPIFDGERYTKFMRKVIRVAATDVTEQITYVTE
ncbi:MAG: hypothetical protein JNM81_13100 [Rhodospirillaceae bacterium]|nr:hypothetical protein [Rhodospirillaceae bacterium]